MYHTHTESWDLLYTHGQLGEAGRHTHTHTHTHTHRSGKQKVGVMANFVACYLVGVPLGLVLSFTYHQSILGLWWGQVPFYVCSCVFAFICVLICVLLCVVTCVLLCVLICVLLCVVLCVLVRMLGCVLGCVPMCPLFRFLRPVVALAYTIAY